MRERLSHLTDVDKKKFYKSLVNKNYTEAAQEIGLDRHYTNTASLRSAAYQLYKDIDPHKLGIDAEIIAMVKEAIESRRINRGNPPQEVDKNELIDPSDTKEVVVGGRNKAAMLLHKKMDRLNKSKKLLDSTSLTQLATTFGIFFDKSQIMQGQATENIAYHAKIDSNMDPEDSLNLLLQMREGASQTGAKEE